MTAAAAHALANGEAGAIRLRVRGVRKSFTRRGAPPVLAVDGVSFDVPAGMVTALIGPSGCGKSTILRMAAGLETPDEGHLLIDGREITGPGRDRGMVFQSYTSFPWLTVRGNVEYGLKLAGVPKAERRAVRRADHPALVPRWERIRRRRIRASSPAGMRQRVGHCPRPSAHRPAGQSSSADEAARLPHRMRADRWAGPNAVPASSRWVPARPTR